MFQALELAFQTLKWKMLGERDTFSLLLKKKCLPLVSKLPVSYLLQVTPFHPAWLLNS